MYERMLAGQLYIATDPHLAELNHQAQEKLWRFNTTPPSEAAQRNTVLKDLLAAIGPNTEIKPPFRCDYGIHITIGEGVFINHDCIILDCNRVTIGDRVLIAPKVQIYTATHPVDPAVRREGWEYALPVTIGDDAWIGGGAIIGPGVTVGEGSTIGAGSVVMRDVPPRVVAAGNPCRVIRRLDEGLV